MAVGDVMNGLTHGPAAGTIRRLELLLAKACYRRRYLSGQFKDGLDPFLTSVERCIDVPIKFSDGITKVFRHTGRS
jgi:hypothetical protein